MKNINKTVVKYITNSAIILFLIAGIWGVSRWVKDIEVRIEDLEEKYEDLDSTAPKFSLIPYIDEPTKISESEEENELSGSCGHMNPNLITTKSKTSSGLRYYLDYNICELNEYFNWDKLDKYPYPGIFFKITNNFKNISTWCMSVGMFKDNKNPNRIFIISRKVASELGILENSLENISVRVSLMEEDEWKSRKECIDLYNLLEIDEMKTNF